MSSIHLRAPRARGRARLGAVAVAGLALVALSATAASAHVHVDPDETAAGEFTVLTFRVPNESATAATSKIVVDLPTDHPLLSVSTKPVPGWTATVATAPLPAPVDFHGTTLTEAPAHVTWTADAGSEIADGQFQEFEISAGPLPDAGTDLAFPTHQTYTDGTVADWTDPTPASGEEPEHPVPAFTTTAGSTDQDGGANTADTTARTLAVLGVVLGGAALVVAVASARRRRGDA